MSTCRILMLIFFFTSEAYGVRPTVTIPLGKVVGINRTTRHGRNISAFLAIPYAQPPIGPLRFRNPLPVQPWDDTLWADKEPQACPQVTESGVLNGIEDCLHLNVYTPQMNTNDQLLPVMVYIHGGAFQTGDTKTNFLGPDYILDKDVVLVTLQYRLDVLGFMSTGDAEAPGNFGLKDQALAIKWVHDNIEYFGGNSNNVTLFGQSSGSVSVNFQVISNATRGMFHRYILQSGTVLCPWAFMNSADYKKYSFELGKIYGCPINSSKALVECLREVPAYDLISVDSMFSDLQKMTRVTWVTTDEPGIEGAFLTEHPMKTILKKQFQDLPNISGVVKDEGLMVTVNLYANDTLYETLLGDLDGFLFFLASTYVPSDKAKRLADNLKRFYFDDIEVNNKTQVLQRMTTFISDVSIIFPHVLQLQLVSQRSKNPSYFYSFEYRGTFSKTSVKLRSNSNLGVTHGDELIYLFPVESVYFNLPDNRMDVNDQRMIDMFVDMWTNFAKTGVPSTGLTGDPEIWQPYTEHDCHLQIGQSNQLTLISQHHFLDERMHFWAMQILKLVFWSLL